MCSSLYQGSDKQKGDPVLSVMVDCNAFHQTSDWNELLFPHTLYTSEQTYPTHVHLPSAWIKSPWLPSAGSTFVWILFLFLDRFNHEQPRVALNPGIQGVYHNSLV